MRLFHAAVAIAAISCGDPPRSVPSDIPAPIQPGQEVDPCSCDPKPYTTDGSVQDVNCKYGWKVILDCQDLCPSGSPQWKTTCGPISN